MPASLAEDRAAQWGAPRRPGEAARSLDEVARELAAWTAARHPESGPVVDNLRRPVGAGGSNETILFDLTSTDADGTRSRRPLVLRIEPGSYRLFRRVDLKQQFDLLRALGADGLVKVPQVFEFESDPSIFGQPFFIMDQVRGRVPVSTPPYNAQGFLPDASPAQRERLWTSAVEELARIHAVPSSAVPMLGSEADGWEADYREQLASFAWAADGRELPFLTRTLDWLEVNKPRQRMSGLSWGDARIGNMIFDDDFRLAAVLDWEQASLGGPLRDLGWWLFFDELYSDGAGLPRLEGMGARDETIALWSSLTGVRPADIHWYEVFAGFQLGVLMLRRCDLQGRSAPGQNGENNIFTRQVARKLGTPEPADLLGVRNR